MNICILGSNGMLGSQVLSLFNGKKEFKVNASYRNKEVLKNKFFSSLSNTNFFQFDLTNTQNFLNDNFDVIINCIGHVKPRFVQNDFNSINANILLPHFLMGYLKKNKNTKIYQIATDCVYSGLTNSSYNEDSSHDALDEYGKTKSLGEINYNNFFNIRCSIIGKEISSHYSLLDWFLNVKEPEINGFNNHKWNGITTLAFAKIVYGILINEIDIPNSIHVLPKDVVTKYDLLEIFKKTFNKNIKIKNFLAPTAINRVLTTKYHLNDKIWSNAGYDDIPNINELVNEIKQ